MQEVGRGPEVIILGALDAHMKYFDAHTDMTGEETAGLDRG